MSTNTMRYQLYSHTGKAQNQVEFVCNDSSQKIIIREQRTEVMWEQKNENDLQQNNELEITSFDRNLN